MRNILLGLLLVSVMFLAACSTDAPVTGDGVEEVSGEAALSNNVYQVVVDDLSLIPADIDIEVGDTIEWVNKDFVSHTVEFDNGMFSTEVLPSSVVSYRFMEAGSFGYLSVPQDTDNPEFEFENFVGTVNVK